MYSLLSVSESFFLRCIQRRLWPLGDNSCSTNPSSSSIHCFHRINHSVALGMGWCNPVHRFGVILSGLELGSIPLECLFGYFWPLGLGRCSFSDQLGVQERAENTIV